MAESQEWKAQVLHLHRFQISLQQRGTDSQHPIFNLNFKAPKKGSYFNAPFGFPKAFLSILMVIRNQDFSHFQVSPVPFLPHTGDLGN